MKKHEDRAVTWLVIYEDMGDRNPIGSIELAEEENDWMAHCDACGEELRDSNLRRLVEWLENHEGEEEPRSKRIEDLPRLSMDDLAELGLTRESLAAAVAIDAAAPEGDLVAEIVTKFCSSCEEERAGVMVTSVRMRCATCGEVVVVVPHFDDDGEPIEETELDGTPLDADEIQGLIADGFAPRHGANEPSMGGEF